MSSAILARGARAVLLAAVALLACGAPSVVRAAGGAAADAGHYTLFPRPLSPLAAQSDSVIYQSAVASGNDVGVTITNYGFIGNNWISRSPSLEYPLGQGYEHLVRGGLWIGAQATDARGPFTGVTTAAVDGAIGNATPDATEYTPVPHTAITERSTLKTNQFFNPHAVSELDIMSDYADPPKSNRATNTNEDHRSLGIRVHQEDYSWSFSRYTNVHFIHYQIINQGPPLQNVWVGIYSELASACKKCYAQWPTTDQVEGSPFKKKWIATDDTLTVSEGTTVKAMPADEREHYCLALPVPNGCNNPHVPYWVGFKVLGTKRSRADTATVKHVTFSSWSYAPGSPFRDQDIERYPLMSNGVIQPVVGDSLQPSTGDPVELISTGPFSEIDPGDTVAVDFAIIGGRGAADVGTDSQIRDFQENARFAQRAYDRNYIVPVPPPSPRLLAVPRHNAVDLYWDDEPENFVDPTTTIGKDFEGYRVYLSDDRLDLHRVAQFDLAGAPHDTTGYNTGFGAIAHDTTIAGVHYKYRYTIDHLRDGFKYFTAVTAYDLGNVEIESLESGIPQNKTEVIPAPGAGEKVAGDQVTVFPNPYRVEARWDVGANARDHYLWFGNLPTHSKLKVFTIAGDLVYETDFDGASYHGASARGVYNPATDLDVGAPSLSGRTFAWNMISREGQAIASGLYMFAVQDKDTGHVQRGKFLVVKSDREN